MRGPLEAVLQLPFPDHAGRVAGGLEGVGAAAAEIGVFGASHAALSWRCSVELYIGDNLLHLPDQRVREILALWSDALAH